MKHSNKGISRNLSISLILELLIFFLLCKKINSLNDTQYSRQISTLELDTIHKYLDKINKPSVFTIESPDGDIIDCVDIRKQPALDHPLLKHHKIQRAPSETPMGTNNITKGMWQIWHQKGQHCPNGTIPVRRITVNDVLRAKSLDEFGKKPDLRAGHEYAIAYTQTLPNIYGTSAGMNVWNPSVESYGEFSLSQIWVIGGYNEPDLNTIESGWQVCPMKYHDTRTRLFIYWTSDGYQSTGCYNLECPGFVQISQQIVVGAAISVSSMGGRLYDIILKIWKDPVTGNWWLIYNNVVSVGYWPKDIFTHLKDQASMIHWGGEIVNNHVLNVHTSTKMGSGLFPHEGYGRASYFRNIYIVGPNNTSYELHHLDTKVDNPYCYDIEMYYGGSYGTHFFYGGPGRNPNCP